MRRLKRPDRFRILRIAQSATEHLGAQRLLRGLSQIGIIAGELEQFTLVFLAVLRGQSLPLLNRIDLHGQKYTAIPERVRAFQGLRAPLPSSGATIQSKMQADVAQLVEQLIRNQQVVSSSLTVGSRAFFPSSPSR